MNIEHDAEFLGLFIEGPDLGIVHISVFRGIEFEEFGTPFFNPVHQLLDNVLYARCLMGETLG